MGGLPDPYHGYEGPGGIRDRETYGRPHGRIDRSFSLMSQSWRFLRANPRLFALPALSSLATAIAAAAIFAPTLYAAREMDGRVAMLIAGAISAIPLIFIATFFNVGFLAMVAAQREGEAVSIRTGLRAAAGRLPQIAGWTLLSAVVGTILNTLARLPGGELLANVLGWLGGLAWYLATFFVVPILAIEGTGPVRSVRRSAEVFRRRWGETVTADIALGILFGVLMVPGLICGIAGAEAIEQDNLTLGVSLIVAAAFLLAPPLVASSAITELFTYELYRFSLDGEERVVGGPFTSGQLAAAIQPKRRWWRR